MNRVYQIIIFLLFVWHQSMAQTDRTRISGLPFNTFMTLCNDSIKLTECQDTLLVLGWKQREKIDSLIKWKLVELKIYDSGEHAGLGELISTTKSSVYRVTDILPIINSDTLNKYFKLNESNILKTRNWNYQDQSTDWTIFQNDNILMISRRDRFIGNMYDYTTVYEYYFEEIK